MSKTTGLRTRPLTRADLTDRAIALFRRHAVPADDSSACWLWRGRINPVSGYGRLTMGRPARELLAHRVSWVLHRDEPLCEDLVLDHLCRVRPCVNPAHLEQVTQEENMARGESARGIHARTPKRYVSLRGVVTWRVRYRTYEDGGKVERSKTFATEPEAVAWIEDHRIDSPRGALA